MNANNMKKESAARGSLLPWAFGFTVLCLLAAGVLALLNRQPAHSGSSVEQLALVTQQIPFEAQNALRGEASAFDALGKTVARMKTLRGEVEIGALATDPDWSKLQNRVGTAWPSRFSRLAEISAVRSVRCSRRSW